METPFFAERAVKAREGVLDWHRCRTVEDLLVRCRRLDQLYCDIKSHGYLSKLELAKRTRKDAMHSIPRWNPALFEYLMDEVVVNIGRRGDLLFVGGQHRLAMSQLLSVHKIPVRVLVRHKSWQELRDNVYSRGTDWLAECDVPATHPDLQDILP